ncbi:Aldehyde dehydrogenase [Balamuthia mandrillaris]
MKRVAAAQVKQAKGVLPFYLGCKPVTKPASSVVGVLDKYTNEVTYEVSLASKSDIAEGIKLAAAAEPAMKSMKHYERKEVLLGIANDLLKRQDEFIYTLCVEAGKPVRDARVELNRAVDTFTAAAEESVRLHGEHLPLDISSRNVGFAGIVRRFPVGLVSMVAPFNFPLNLVAHKVAPAIAAGCPFVLKPSDKTPVSSLLLAESLSKAALPAGSFSVLPCSHEDASLFSEDERIKVLTFTGSETVGWKLHANAKRKKVVLELGGNAPCICDETAVRSPEDLERIANRIAFGAFYYAGQSCISVQRIYAHESIYEALKEKLVKHAHSYSAQRGDPMKEETFLGPLIGEKDAQRVESWVNEAVEKGAKVLVGGKRDGSFYDCTVVENVAPDVNLSCQEVFGPVCTIEKFTDFKALVQHINKSRFGLQAGVFTKDIHRAFYAYENLQMGGVVINDIPSSRVDTQPYGGVKASGTGREGIRYSIEDYTEMKIMLMKDVGQL